MRKQTSRNPSKKWAEDIDHNIVIPHLCKVCFLGSIRNSLNVHPRPCFGVGLEHNVLKYGLNKSNCWIDTTSGYSSSNGNHSKKGQTNAKSVDEKIISSVVVLDAQDNTYKDEGNYKLA